MMISEMIKEIRKNVNMTQDEMAQALYVTRQAVSRWENGDTTPNLETLTQISKMFGVSLDRLLEAYQNTDNTTAEINADRFIGFADIYENSRPTVPAHAI
ncbi:MAG: helix-turn-helix domain-containing protein, partial [Oscillospiraceae bacterium]|nr:helix-turn-helix domain-containing protein [Oscillospiraceae bacterium]